MAKNSHIEWTTHTFNGWRGCTKVSPGCKNCYAEKLVTTRLRGEWGPGAPRQLASDAMWREPLAWDREAARDLHEFETTGAITDESGAVIATSYERPRVFCSSLADVFDHEVPVEWRVRLFDLIEKTPHLDWLLLTKRPQHWAERTIEAARAGSGFAYRWIEGAAPANVWIGASVEDQARADERIPELLSIPARVHFLSCEPLLGPVAGIFDVDGVIAQSMGPRSLAFPVDLIDWVIVGGESGPDARPMHPDWARSLRDQCAAAGVAFHFKQWGQNIPFNQVTTDEQREAFSRATVAGKQSYFGACIVPCPTGGMMTGTTPGIVPVSYASIGKSAAGRFLDGVEHNGYPTRTDHA